ncbi:heat shock factor protein 2-like [Bacillus rossius redtenbacheri]|uniref:heat shock factor protein 2-like n=1 Tax=Bacillus rossius redtenbacheri TaxID=93214 RepID=UPI002FDE66D9
MKFPQKLWEIINSCETNAIQWSDKGSTILIDYSNFQDQYLRSGSSIFKTRNINSFVRQLNMYGFRKVTSAYRDPVWNLHNPNIHEFYHKNFCATRKHLLVDVVRKAKHSKKLSKHFMIDHHSSSHAENKFSAVSSDLLFQNKPGESIAAKYYLSVKQNKPEEMCFVHTSETSNARLAVARTALRKALEDASAKSLPYISSYIKEEFCEDNEFLPGEASPELTEPGLDSDATVNWGEKSAFPLLLNNAEDPTFQIPTAGHATTFDKLQGTAAWTAEDLPLPADFSFNDIGQHAELLLQSTMNFPTDTVNNDQQFGQQDGSTIAHNFMDLIDLPTFTLANKSQDYLQTYTAS